MPAFILGAFARSAAMPSSVNGLCDKNWSAFVVLSPLAISMAEGGGAMEGCGSGYICVWIRR